MNGPPFTLARMHELAVRLPDDGALTLTKASLLEALGDVRVQTAANPPADLTVADVAAHFRRSPSTVRGWLEAGRFAGAYKLNGRDWRVPRTALAAFSDAQQGKRSALSAWRAGRRRASRST